MTRTAARVGTAICVTVCCIFAAGVATSTIGNDGGFRLLELDGHHVKWGEAELGHGATVKYAFVDAPRYSDGARNCRVLMPIDSLAIRHGISRATLHAEAAAAFLVWEEAANITFVAVDDPERADILRVRYPLHACARDWPCDRPGSSRPVRTNHVLQIH